MDGLHRQLFLLQKNENFSGLSIEPDSEKFKKMNFLYKNFNNTHLSNSKVTPENVIYLLKEFDVPENFDLLNLDIDSYDLFVVKGLFRFISTENYLNGN